MKGPQEVAEAIEKALDTLESLVAEIQEAGFHAARTESSFKTEFAKARLTVKATALDKLTVSDIEAEAMIQCEELHLSYLIAANNLTTVREAIRVGIARVDALRSLLASYRNVG